MLLDELTVYAVDFDGTLCKGPWPFVGEPNWSVIEKVVSLQAKEEVRTVLWTCRTGEKLEEAIDFCNKWGLRFDAVNEPLPELVEKFGLDANWRKIGADYYLDDKALTIEEFLKGDSLWEKLKDGRIFSFPVPVRGMHCLFLKMVRTMPI